MTPRKEYEAAAAAVDHAVSIGERADIIDGLRADARRLAHRVAVLLGHVPLRQRNEVECFRCGRSGFVGAKLTGAVHTEQRS